MMTSSNGNIPVQLALCAGEFTGPGEFPTQRPVTRNYDVFFVLRSNWRLSKQSSGWWFETPSWSLWRHCNEQGKPWCSAGYCTQINFLQNTHIKTRPFGRGMAYHVFVHTLIYILLQSESLQWYIHYQIILDMSALPTPYLCMYVVRESVCRAHIPSTDKKIPTVRCVTLLFVSLPQ